MPRHAPRPLRALLTAAALCTALVAVPSAAATAPVESHESAGRPQGKVSAFAYSHKLARQMNAVRERHDLRPLRVVRCLNGFAAPWARHLARSGQFYHQDLTPMLGRCNLSSVGEIIAQGSVPPRRMIGMWLDSPGHRDLLLEPSFRVAGVAGRRANGASPWVGCIDFGRR